MKNEAAAKTEDRAPDKATHRIFFSESFDFDQKVCSIGLARSGRLLLALADGVYFFTPATGMLELLVRPEPDRPEHSLNDGKVGPDGAFWVGSIEETPERAPVGSLYRISADGRCRRISTR